MLFHLVGLTLMPKDNTKADERPAFHDHSKRPFVARQYAPTSSNVSVSGGSSSTFLSSLVTGTAPALTPNDAQEYPMPMDVDDDSNGVDNEVPPLLPAGPALYTGLPGVKVIPLVRKRYKNSVSTFIVLKCRPMAQQTTGHTSGYLGTASG